MKVKYTIDKDKLRNILLTIITIILALGQYGSIKDIVGEYIKPTDISASIVTRSNYDSNVITASAIGKGYIRYGKLMTKDVLHIETTFADTVKLASLDFTLDEPATGQLKLIAVQTGAIVADISYDSAISVRIIPDEVYIKPGEWLTISNSPAASAKVYISFKD